jgi:hypothetical protein
VGGDLFAYQGARVKNALGEFTPSELRQLRSLRSPAGIQRFMDDMRYHLAGTSWSPRKVLREQTAHCLEGAIFAAAALRAIGFPPLLMDMEAVNDTDHVVAIFQIGNCWGALAKSNYSGCRYREPVYRSLRELAMSYFEDYFSPRRHRSLRTYSRPVNLARFDARHWMTAEKSVWFIADYLCDIGHTALISRAQAKRLVRLDARSFEAGVVGQRRK